MSAAGALPRSGVGVRLQQLLGEQPRRIVLHLVDTAGAVQSVSAAELVDRAHAFAAEYRSRGCVDKPVAVCLYHGLDLYAGFIGALWAGAVPTMLPPPSPRIEPAKYYRSFRHVRDYIAPAAILIDHRTRAALDAAGHLGDLDERLVDAQSVAPAAPYAAYERALDDVILVQHSSGTTGLQKGVALSSREVFAHNAAYTATLEITERDVIVSWLPLYHDMGFIACFLLPLLTGVPVVAMSPFDWVQRPAMLLEHIHAFRGTLCWLPNFAFNYLAVSVRPSQVRADLDLSSIRAWVNSSEPVTERSFRAFLTRYEAHGVSEAQLTASYAMAENVYAVTQSLPGALRVLHVDRGAFREHHRAVSAEASAGAMALVSNGRVVEGTEVRVLDDAHAPVPDGTVGEIALRGRFLFSGYHGRPDLTAAAMTDGGWYLTGDLGFLHEGELYVTGRKKDLIIIQGRNYYPADIEEAVANVEGVLSGRVAAFGVRDERTGTEGLVIVAEVGDERQQDASIVAAIRASVAQEFDCTPSDVRLLPAKWLVKSSSGKVARNDNREKYLEQFRPQTPTPEVLGV